MIINIFFVQCLCSPVPNDPRTHTSPGPGDWRSVLYNASPTLGDPLPLRGHRYTVIADVQQTQSRKSWAHRLCGLLQAQMLFRSVWHNKVQKSWAKVKADQTVGRVRCTSSHHWSHQRETGETTTANCYNNRPNK